ncbi:cutinase OS=Streptomyces tendae OX=1932 GN=F3L20_25455 PE=3 SV=1 [Streptomyces tendae]
MNRVVRFISETSSDGVREQLFTLGDIPGALWTPEGAVATRPLVLVGHGGGQHKKAPDVLARAHRFVTECGFAVVAVDVPAHGDRPKVEDYDRIATENQARVEAGEELAPLIAAFQALVARRTVPEWRAVLDAVQQLEHVGAGPVGDRGFSLGCGLGVPFVAARTARPRGGTGLGGALASGRPPPGSPSQWSSWCSGTTSGYREIRAWRCSTPWPRTRKHCTPTPAAGEIPAFELESTLRFFARHLG